LNSSIYCGTERFFVHSGLHTDADYFLNIFLRKASHPDLILLHSHNPAAPKETGGSRDQYFEYFMFSDGAMR
jgi:hypothetical protein